MRPPAQVPLLPKLRGNFAEFLNHSSPDRFSILYLTTCVGFGYGPYAHSLEAFLDSTGSPTSPNNRATHHASHTMTMAFHTPSCHTLTPQSNKWLGYHTASPHHLTTTTQAPRITPTQHHKVVPWPAIRVVSITASSLDAHTRVREYQPVDHRLRLSASP